MTNVWIYCSMREWYMILFLSSPHNLSSFNIDNVQTQICLKWDLWLVWAIFKYEKISKIMRKKKKTNPHTHTHSQPKPCKGSQKKNKYTQKKVHGSVFAFLLYKPMLKHDLWHKTVRVSLIHAHARTFTRPHCSKQMNRHAYRILHTLTFVCVPHINGIYCILRVT